MVRTLQFILGAAGAPGKWPLCMLLKVMFAAVDTGVWRGKKEQRDLAGATSGVQGRAGGQDHGADRTGGKKQMKGRHTVVTESIELGDGFDVGGGKRGESRMARSYAQTD